MRLGSTTLLYYTKIRAATATRNRSSSAPDQGKALGPNPLWPPRSTTWLYYTKTATATRNRSTSARLRLKKRPLARITPLSPSRSTTWLYYTKARAATATRNRSSSARLRYMKMPLAWSVATALNSLALLYQDQGRYSDAEPLYKRSFKIYEKALGPDHPSIAVTLNNLAVLYNAQGRYSDAEPLYKRSLAIKEKTLGPYHPSVSNTLTNLAFLNYEQNKPVEALGYTRRAAKILRTRVDRPTTRQEESVQSEQRATKWTFFAHADFALSDGHTEPRVGLEREHLGIVAGGSFGDRRAIRGCLRVRPQAVQVT